MSLKQPAGVSAPIRDISPPVKDRIVFLGEEVNDVTATWLWLSLFLNLRRNPGKDINFYINSPGGSVTAGMTMYDTMNYIKCDVSTCIGMAAHIGAFTVSGAKGKNCARL